MATLESIRDQAGESEGVMSDSICGDCPDYKTVFGSVYGICNTIEKRVCADGPVCPPRRRELEALAEVERLEKENMRLRGELGHMRHRMQLMGGIS